MSPVQPEARRATRAHVAHRRGLRDVSRHGRLVLPSDLASAASAGTASGAARVRAARAARSVGAARAPAAVRCTTTVPSCAASPAIRLGHSFHHRRLRLSRHNRCIDTVRRQSRRRGWRAVGRAACQPEYRGDAQRTGAGLPLLRRRTAVLPDAPPPPSRRRSRRGGRWCRDAQRRPRVRHREAVANPAIGQ
jgi:hypothetical protein